MAIAGLDAASGLRRVRGRQDLYLSILRKFVDLEHDFPTRIRAALAQPDWSEAQRMAHNLKGASAMIGANELVDLAYRLELAIRQRALAQEFEEAQHDLCLYLAGLIQALHALLPAATNTVNTVNTEHPDSQPGAAPRP